MGPKKEDWDRLRVLQADHSMCMRELRKMKERLQFLENRNIELGEMLNRHLQRKKPKYHR
jgi:hypothetical protein